MKPRIFLGSSAQQEKLLQALTRGLQDIADVEPWTSVFNPGVSTLDRLVELTREVDFAAFIFAQDDWTSKGALPDPGGGQSAAVVAGLARVDTHALVVNADLPCVTARALERLAAAGLALVEADDGTTNALSLPDPTAFEPHFGPGSAARFRAASSYATARIAELRADVDTLDDLERLALPLGPRTRALLAVHA